MTTYFLQGKESVPLTTEEVQALLDDGSLLAGNMLRRDSEQVFHRIDNLSEFAVNLNPGGERGRVQLSSAPLSRRATGASLQKRYELRDRGALDSSQRTRPRFSSAERSRMHGQMLARSHERFNGRMTILKYSVLGFLALLAALFIFGGPAHKWEPAPGEPFCTCNRYKNGEWVGSFKIKPGQTCNDRRYGDQEECHAGPVPTGSPRGIRRAKVSPVTK